MLKNVGGLAITTMLANIIGTNRIFQNLTGSFKTTKDIIGVVKMVKEIKASASNWLSISKTTKLHKAMIPYKKA